MSTLDHDGTKLFYEEAGKGDPPIVFVHGWTCDHTHFTPQAEHFRPRHRVVALDLRGHGQSDQPEQGYTIADLADEVSWICKELGVGTPVIVGHSMGAAVALELAARHPQLPSAIVMVDAAPIVMTPELKSLLAGFVEGLRGPEHLTVRRGFIEGMLFIHADDPDRKARIVEQMISTPQHVAVSCMEAIVGWDGAAAARACSVPALHIGAAQPINDAAALRGLNPIIQTAQTVGAGHFNMLEVPDQVNPMIERFLAVTVAPTPAPARARP